MRLLITVLWCLIVIHGSSSVPGFRRKHAKTFLASALGQGIWLKDGVVNNGNGLIEDNQGKEQPLITNISVQNINQNNDDNPVQIAKEKGNYKDNSNVIQNNLNVKENSNDNIDYSALSSEKNKNVVSEDSLNSDPGIKNVVQSRSRREVAEPKKTVKTYRYVSQPRRSRFSYIQKIQKLFNPNEPTTPNILTKHKTIVVEKHTAHEEHNSEEIHEHHTTTTSQSKISKKKRKSKRKLGSLGTTDSAEDIEDEESTGEEIAESDNLAIKDNSSKVTGAESKPKSDKLKIARVIQPNISVIAIRNKTQNSLEQQENVIKENKIMLDNKSVSKQTMNILENEVNIFKNENVSKDPQSVELTKVKIENPVGITRSSYLDLAQKEEATTVDSASSLAMQTTNVLKSNTQIKNLPNLSTLPAPNYKQLSRQNVSSGGRNLKSFLKIAFGLRGNNSPEQTTVEVEKPSSVLRESLSVRNISTVSNNFLNNKDANNDAIIGNREPTFKDPNTAEKLTTSIKKQIKAPLESSKIKEINFKIPKNKLSAPMGRFYKTDIVSEEENTEMNRNFKTDNSETVFKVTKVLASTSSVPNLPDVFAANVQTIPKSITTTKNQPYVASIHPLVIGERELGGDTIADSKEIGNNPAVPLTSQIVSNEPDHTSSHPLVIGEREPDHTSSQPLLIGENLSLAPNEPNVSKNILTGLIPSTTIENSSQVSSALPCKKRVPKFRRPNNKTITPKEVSYDKDLNGSEEEIIEKKNRVNINNTETDFDIPKIVDNIPSSPIRPNVPENSNKYPKRTTTNQNWLNLPISKPFKTRIPKFMWPKGKTITTSKELLCNKNVIEPEKKPTEINKNVEYDTHSHKTLFKIPKVRDNLSTLPNVPDVPLNIPTLPKPITTILNWPSPNKRIPKFKNKAITTSNEVLYDTDVIESEEENTEISNNVETVTDETALKISKNIPTILNYTTAQNWQTALSSPEPKKRVPKFRRPKSKVITTSKEIVYDTDAIDSENENTKIKHADETDNSGTAFQIKKILGNLSSPPNGPKRFPNTPNVPKSTTTVKNSPSSQPWKKRVPKFRRPKSKTLTTSNEVSDTEIINSENENIEINNNVEDDTTGTLFDSPKADRNLPSIPNVSNVISNILTLPKQTAKIINWSSPLTLHSSKTRIPKFRRPKSKAINTSKKVLFDTDAIEPEEENTEISSNDEIATNRTAYKIPNKGGNLPSFPNESNASSNNRTVLKATTTMQYPSSTHSSQLSETRIPIFNGALNKAITKEIYDTEVDDSEEKNTEIDHNIEIDDSKTILKSPNTEGNPPSLLNLPNKSSKIPTILSSTATVKNWQTSPSSLPYQKRFPKFRKSKSMVITTSKEVLFDTDDNDLEYKNTEIKHNDEINNRGTVLPSFPNVSNVTSNNQTVLKANVTMQYSPSAPSSQLSEKRTHKFKKPLSKEITKEILYDKEVDDSEEENTEINHNTEIENNRTILKISKIEKPYSLPNVPKDFQNIPNVPISTMTIQNLQTSPFTQPFKSRIPKFKRPKSKTVVTSKEIIDKDVISREDDNTKLNHNDEIHNAGANFKMPKIVGNLPSLPNVPKLSSNLPTIPRLTTTLQNWLSLPNSQLSNTRVPKFRRPKSKKISTSKEILFDEEVNDSNGENTNNTEIVSKVPKVLQNISSVPIVPNISSKIPPLPKERETVVHVPAIPITTKVADKLTVTTRPPASTGSKPVNSFKSLVKSDNKLCNPKNKEFRVSVEESNDTDIHNSKNENTEVNNNDGIENSGTLNKEDGNLSKVTNIPKLSTYIPDFVKSITNFRSWPATSTSQLSLTQRIPISGSVSPVMDSINDNNENNFERYSPQGNANEYLNQPKPIEDISDGQKISKPAVNLPAVPRLTTTPNKQTIYALSQTSESKIPESDLKSKDAANDNDELITDAEIFDVSRSSRRSKNDPLEDTLQTSTIKVPKLERSNTKNIPKSTEESKDTDDLNSEEDYKELKNENEIAKDTESNFKDPKMLKHNLNTLNVPKVGGNHPTISRTTTSSKNEPIGGSSGLSVKEGMAQNPTVSTPTDSKSHSPGINHNGDTFVNPSEKIYDEPSISKESTAADRLSDIPSSPMTFLNWPFFSPSPALPIRVPKLKRPNTKIVPTITKGSKDTDELNSEEDNTEIKNENEIDKNTESNFMDPKMLKHNLNISNVAKEDGNHPTIPRIPKSSENKPADGYSGPSVKESPITQKSNTKAVSTPTDSKSQSPEINHNGPEKISDEPSISKESAKADRLQDVTSSPMTFVNWPYFASSPTLPINVPKLKRSNTKTVKSKDIDELNSEDDTKINKENIIDNNTEKHSKVPKVLKHIPTISHESKATENLLTNPRWSKISENEPVNGLSGSSVNKILKPKKPKTKAVPTLTDSKRYSPGLNDYPGTFINQPEESDDKPSDSKVPGVSNNLPKIKNSATTIGNWPFFTPSQSSPKWAEKHRIPNKKAALSSSKRYNPEFTDNTRAFTNLHNLVSNFHSFNSSPRLTKNILAFSDTPVYHQVIGRPMTQENKTFYSSLEPSHVRFPKLKNPKIKFTPLFPGRHNNDNFNADKYRQESTETFLNLPKIVENFHIIPKEPAVIHNLQTITKSPMTFRGWPLYTPHSSPARISKLTPPIRKADSLSQNIVYNNEDLKSESYSSDVNNQIKNVFNIESEKTSIVPNLPVKQGNQLVIAPIQQSVTRIPKLGRPLTKTFLDTGGFNPKIDETGLNRDNEIYNTGGFFNFLKSLRNLPFISKLTENMTTVPKPATISESQRELPSPLATRESTLKTPKYKDFPSFPNNLYDNYPNERRHTSELDDDTGILFNAPKVIDNLPFVPKVSRLAGNTLYVSRTPRQFGNWHVNASPQLSVGKLPNRMRPKIMAVKPSTKIYYAGKPISEMYNTGNFFRVPKSPVIKGNVHHIPKLPLAMYDHPLLAPSTSRIVKAPIMRALPFGKIVPNPKLYYRNIVPSITGHIRPVPKVPTPLYMPHTINIPTVVGNLVPAPKISLIAESRRKVPMIVENHSGVAIASPSSTEMKNTIVKNINNRVIPSVSGNSHRSNAINSKSYNTFLRNISPLPKVSNVRKPQVLHIPSPSMINLSKSWNGLYKNEFFDIEKSNTRLTETVHWQMDEHETMDMVALEKRADRTIWGIPISNAVGKIQYLTMGNREGDMNFITSTDKLGRVQYLYRVKDDSGHYHNLHLKTTGGHLSLVESDYRGGRHSTGFIGYDETGEYIIPIHLEENHRLVIDPYAHNLRYAVDVHPAYEIAAEVFYYKK